MEQKFDEAVRLYETYKAFWDMLKKAWGDFDQHPELFLRGMPRDAHPSYVMGALGYPELSAQLLRKPVPVEEHPYIMISDKAEEAGPLYTGAEVMPPIVPPGPPPPDPTSEEIWHFVKELEIASIDYMKKIADLAVTAKLKHPQHYSPAFEMAIAAISIGAEARAHSMSSIPSDM